MLYISTEIRTLASRDGVSSQLTQTTLRSVHDEPSAGNLQNNLTTDSPSFTPPQASPALRLVNSVGEALKQTSGGWRAVA